MGKLGSLFDDIAKSAKSNSKDITDALDLVGGRAGDLGKRLNASVAKVGDFAKGLKSIPPQALAVGAALGVATVAIGSFLALGNRGANFQGIIDGFKQTGVSIIALREAARGTISDIQLMTTANIALAGATGIVRQEFGEKLPQLLEIARVQARTTGQSVDFLFNSLVGGIKRSSPLLIDNTGLVLKVGEANEAYAKSIGKTVEQLSAQEKQVALLQATLEAGQVAVQTTANAQETAGEKLARIGATITNTFDRLAFAIQPAFEAVLDVVDGIVSFIGNAVSQIAPVIQFIATVFQSVFSFIGQLLGEILTPVRNVLQGVLDFIIGQSKNFALGGAKLFGAFTNGVAFIINRTLLPIIAAAAQAIADLLVGQSPPPKGPLKNIDKGGENTMLAWLQGFAGVSIDPVEKVAQGVVDSLGNIARFSLQQVKRRLSELDLAVQPFIDQLDIAKAKFEAIQEPAEQAIDAIDRQIEKFLQSAVDGDENAKNVIRNLDARKELIQQQLNLNQGIVDQASIQLALVQAQQAEERALLAIQANRVKSQESQTKAVGETSKAISQAGKVASKAGKITSDRAKGGSGQADQPSLGGLSTPAFDANQFGQNAGFIPDLEAGGLFGELGTAFLEPLINSGELATATGFVSDISGNLTRLREGVSENGIGGTITNAFNNLPKVLGNIFDSAGDTIDNFFNGDGEGTLRGIISGLPAQIPVIFADFAVGIGNALLAPFGTSIADIEVLLLGEGAEGSLKANIVNFVSGIPGFLSNLGTNLINGLVTPFTDKIAEVADLFSPENIDALPGKIADFVASIPSLLGGLLTGENSIFNILASPFVDSVTDIENLLSGDNAEALPAKILAFVTSIPTMFAGLIGTGGLSLVANLAQPFLDAGTSIISFLTGDGEESLGAKISSFVNLIPSFLKGLIAEGGTLVLNLVQPFLDAGGSIINFLIGDGSDGTFTLRSAISSIATNIGTWIGDVGGKFIEFFSQPISNVMSGIVSFLTNPNHEDGGLAFLLTNFFSGDASQEGSLAYILNAVGHVFGELPGKIKNALVGIGGSFWDAFVVPIIGAINWVIGGLNDFIDIFESNYQCD